MTADPANALAPAMFRHGETRTIEKAIRRMVRAHDLQSKALSKAVGLTSAQLVLMKGIAELGEVTSAALSVYADISAATVVTVLEPLGAMFLERFGRLGEAERRRITQAAVDLANLLSRDIPGDNAA